MNIFKNIRLWYLYVSILKTHKKEITDRRNGLSLNIDLAHRISFMYVHDIKNDTLQTYGQRMAETNIKNQLNKVENFLEPFGLSELIGLLDIKDASLRNDKGIEVDAKHIIYIGYKFFKTTTVYRNLIIFTIVAILSSILFFV